MTGTFDVTLLVSGEVERLVDPDEGALWGALRAEEHDRGAALARVAEAQHDLENALHGLGARRFTAGTYRAPLTWSTASVTTGIAWDRQGKQPARRGWVATAGVRVTVRDFQLLGRLMGAVADAPLLHVWAAEWAVDGDNPVRSELRGEAVRSAMAKARDYAAALGGRVTRVVEVTDRVALDNVHDGAASRVALGFGRFSGGEDEDGGTVNLDPVPQRIVAAVEVRFAADVPPVD